MRRNVQGVAGFVLGLGLVALPNLAAAQAADRIVPVDPRVSPTIIKPAELLGVEAPPNATIIANTGVLRGTLTRDSGTGDFSFAPTTEFWTLGTDRFTYTMFDPATGGTSIGLVSLIGQTADVLDSIATFDTSSLAPWAVDEVQGTGTVGGGKLTILGTPSPPQLAEVNVHRADFHGSILIGLTQGGKVVGGGNSPPPQPPPPPPGSQLLGEDFWSFVLMKGVALDGSSPFWIELRPTPEGDDIRIRALTEAGGAPDWIWIGAGPHEYELNWWEGPPMVGQEQPTRNLMLWVDGLLVQTLAVLQLELVDRFAMGVLSPHPITSPGLAIDDLALYAWGTGAPKGRVTLRVRETLEDGVANELDSTGATAVNSLNAMNGTKDLTFDAVNGQTAAISYQNPQGVVDKSWNSRFRLRLDNLQIPVNAIVTVAEAYSNSRDSSPFRLELRKNAGNTHQLRMVIQQTTGVDLVSPWEHVGTVGTNVEVQFWNPRSASFDSGGARLWVGAVLRSELRYAKNHGLTVDGFQMGLIDPDPSILGFSRIDTIQTWANVE